MMYEAVGCFLSKSCTELNLGATKTERIGKQGYDDWFMDQWRRWVYFSQSNATFISKILEKNWSGKNWRFDNAKLLFFRRILEKFAIGNVSLSIYGVQHRWIWNRENSSNKYSPISNIWKRCVLINLSNLNASSNDFTPFFWRLWMKRCDQATFHHRSLTFY